MGLVGSSLKVKTVRPLVRPDTVTPLPSLAIDSCIFTDGSVGFLVTTIDLAKNMSSYSIPLKDTYSPAENMFVYIGRDETCVTFTKDRITGRVFCSISRASNMPRVVRACVTTYDPIENDEIDRIGTLFTKQQ